MLPSTDKSKKIKIYITTYPDIERKYNKPKEKVGAAKMCDQSCMTNNKDRKFICTLCLNEQVCENVSKAKNNTKRLKNNTCPFCHKESKTCIQDASTDTNKTVNKNDCYISDVKYLTSISKGTGTYKCVKLTDENVSSTPTELCRKHESVEESIAKPRQNTADKVCKRTGKPITIEDLNQGGNINHLKSTKPCVETICKGVGPVKSVKDDDTRRKNVSNKYEEQDDEKRVVETQTSKNPMDIKTGLSLLNEVLTVFQNQKHGSNCKDASIQVTDSPNKKLKSLSMSKILKYSILDEEIARDTSKFVILECLQPDGSNTSKTSFHLTKYKSSSIPQMKLEELKYAMKEKTKSKDTVDEVNRMFAIVGKFDKGSKDDLNRPMIRNGPRILPVVKTPGDHPKNTKEVKDNFSEASSVRNCQIQDVKCCKISQTNDYMSGGDSRESCSKCVEGSKCVDKCIYLLSCRHSPQSGQRLCQCCKNAGCRCSQERCVTVKESDSSTNF